jgi:hypothetical protein
MAVEALIPTAGAVVAAAAIDSFNPCTIGAFILLLSVLFGAKKSTKQLLL